MLNTLNDGYTVVTVNKRNLPYKNNFVQVNIVKSTVNTVQAVVKCTASSREPGRLYSVTYTISGQLVGCFTLN